MPTKGAGIFHPWGRMSQTAVFTLLAIHSTKQLLLLLWTLSIGLSACYMQPLNTGEAMVRELRWRRSQATIPLLALNGS